ncbi:hypothetical protein SOPP22_03145 [Shewanella sp. OPT22]|nr:hypothetical protein SOPP22_03145 [Shewanella sp. OPT22]
MTSLQQQKDFFEAYAKFAKVTGNFPAKYLLGIENDTEDQTVIYQKILQQDPQEFISLIMNILGLTTHHDFELVPREIFIMVDNKTNKELHRSYTQVQNPAPLLPLPLEQQTSNLSKQLITFSKEEKLNADNI